MSSYYGQLLLLLFIFAFVLSSNGVLAFGAGNIPSFAYMEGRAFRHGDIEDVLAQLVKKGASAGSGFALASLISKGVKFNDLDIKRVYFGNWLRDYSQAVDIAALKKLPLQTILNICMVLGFMANGYATNEFQVTPERLGCYLPTEHIDNPKGYGDGEDARKYHPQLRGPVDPRELEIDPRTGMKNYIANENGHWDTSKALVRRTIEQCIQLGRKNRAGQGDKYVDYEALRLLGTALHTLEDFPAHSNFCELTLISMGYTDVFTHVGDQVRVQAPNGRWVPPLITGTFGSNDFYHSLIGEAGDHLASVTDLNKEIEKATTKASARGGPSGGDPSSVLRDLLKSIPGSDASDLAREMDAVDQIRANAGLSGTSNRSSGGPSTPGAPIKRPEEMNPQELHSVLWQVLLFRDSVVKKITKTIDKIPGLGALLENISETISVFVFTTLEPFLKPLLQQVTGNLSVISAEVIDTHDQYAVFNDPHASDPTHSFLSKDHFNLILNEPAGKIAQAIVSHAVTLIVKAWDDPSVNVRQTTEDILSCLFHPDFHDPNSKIQREMLQTMKAWVDKLGPIKQSTIARLGKQSVRNHQNIRHAGEGGAPASQGSYAESQAHEFQHTLQGYAGQAPVVGQASSFLHNVGAFPGVKPSRAGDSGFTTAAPPAIGHSYSGSSAHFPGAPGGYAPSYPGSVSLPTPPNRPGYAPVYRAPSSTGSSGIGFPGGGPGGPGGFPAAAPPSGFPVPGSFPAPPASGFPVPGGFPDAGASGYAPPGGSAYHPNYNNSGRQW